MAYDPAHNHNSWQRKEILKIRHDVFLSILSLQNAVAKSPVVVIGKSPFNSIIAKFPCDFIRKISWLAAIGLIRIRHVLRKP